MASKRELMLQAVVAALQVASVDGTTKPTGLQVHRMRTRPISEEDLATGPAMVVWWAGDDPPEYDATQKSDRRARIWVECRARQSGDSPDAALDPLYVWVVKAVLVDITLGGTAVDVDEGRSMPDLEERDEALCALGVEFLIDYQSAFNDPETI